MNYKESKEILQKIEAAGKIAISCHTYPDPDSICSALALKEVLSGMNKHIDVVCRDPVLKDNRFIQGWEDVKQIDFAEFDFGRHDLFISLDASSWDKVVGNENKNMKSMSDIVIDHHRSSTNYGKINLVNGDSSSVCEMLYQMFEDWEVEVDLQVATLLMTGMVADTGSFKFDNASQKTFEIAANLIALGVDRAAINFEMFNNVKLKQYQFWGEVFARMKIEKSGIVWASVPYETMKNYSESESRGVSTHIQNIKDTKFGFLLRESKPGEFDVSFRSRENYDISKIAVAFGGGGHFRAAGVKIKEGSFDEVSKTVLSKAEEMLEKGELS